MDSIVFCTAFVDSDPDRYQGWIDYYTEFFNGENIDLLMVNDGPTNTKLSFKNIRYLDFETHLGRQGIWQFAGWKHSFYEALCFARKYKYIAHVESDCIIRSNGKKEFLKWLRKPKYRTGFCKTYNFPESGLQIINDKSILNYWIDRYSCRENINEVVNFEKFILDDLKPEYILDGDRIESNWERFQPHYTFLSGCTVNSYKEKQLV